MRPSEALAKNRDAVRAIIARYPVTNPRVFGSTARGEDTEASDLDIIVERLGAMSFRDIFEMENAVSEMLGVRVDIRTEAEFSGRILNRIKRDFVTL